MVSQRHKNLRGGRLKRPQHECAPGSRGEILPAADVQEQGPEVLIHTALPGVRREQVHVRLERGVLSIEAEAMGASGRTLYRRIFAVSDRYDAGDIRAIFSNGLLTVSVRKSESARARDIPVEFL